MQLTEQYIEYLLKIKTEHKNIDYKETFNWLQSDRDKKVELVKDILSMANTKNGGKIIFGVRDNDYELMGLQQDDYHSFDTTKVNDFLHQYTDPNFSCQVYKTKIADKMVVVIDVPEFQEVPILCKKEAHSSKNNQIILRKGQIYIRTEKGSSETISSSDAMRELLDRATIKKGDDLIVKIETLFNAKSKTNIYEPVKQKENNGYADLQIRQELKNIFQESDLTLVYQPKSNMTKGIITGVESLVIWNHPLLGPISEDNLLQIPGIEEILPSIGNWVLKTACNQYRVWQDNGYSITNLNIDIYEQQIEDHNFIGMVIDILSELNLNPQQLEFEIRENDMVLLSQNNGISILKQLNRLGINIAIDKFGTGYSSLNYLKKFPINTLKIDKSFVQDPNNNMIVQAITSLASSLNLKVIADGVETIEQLSSLMLAKCEEYQGLLLSKPLSASEMEKSFNTIKHIAGSFIEIDNMVSLK